MAEEKIRFLWRTTCFDGCFEDMTILKQGSTRFILWLIALTAICVGNCFAETGLSVMRSEHKLIRSGGLGVKGGIVNASSLTVDGTKYDLSFAPSGSIYLWSRL